MCVVTLETEWNDLGTFKALYDSEVHDGGAMLGSQSIFRPRTICPGHRKHVGLIGVHDLIVVDTSDALLICDNSQTEQVKRPP